jgi:hypothetical protein
MVAAMLGPRIAIGPFLIVALLLGTLAAAAPGHDDSGCPTPVGVAQGQQHDCAGDPRGLPGSAACQAACAAVVAAPMIAWAVELPLDETTWATAIEADLGGLRRSPDPRPPESRRRI